MRVKIYDKSCLRVITDGLVGDKSKVDVPMTSYLNMRVLRNSGLYYKNRFRLQKVDDQVIPSIRGYAKRYYCPVCGRQMWCTIEDARQPYMSCRRCKSTEVEYLYGRPDSDIIMGAWVEMMGQCYDPLCSGDATAERGVCDDWMDPVNFSMWMDKNMDRARKLALYDGSDVWLMTRKNFWGPDYSEIVCRTPPKSAKKLKVI